MGIAIQNKGGAVFQIGCGDHGKGYFNSYELIVQSDDGIILPYTEMSRKVSDKLKYLVNKGYLLHGSNKKFDVIKPNKKKKIDPRAGLYNAVYATDDPLMAMFLAIIRPEKLPVINGKHKCMICWDYEVSGFRAWLSRNFNTYNAYGVGWIYVVEGKLFTELKKLPHEFYCRKEVLPISVVEVRPKDFLSIVELKFLSADVIREAGFHTEEEIRFMGYE